MQPTPQKSFKRKIPDSQKDDAEEPDLVLLESPKIPIGVAEVQEEVFIPVPIVNTNNS